MPTEIHLKSQIQNKLQILDLLSRLPKYRQSIPWGVFCKQLELPAAIGCTYSNYSVNNYFSEQFGEPQVNECERKVWDLEFCTFTLLIIDGIARISVKPVDTQEDSDPPSQLAFF